MDEKEIKEKMDQVIDLYREDIGSIRTGRATPALIEEIEIAVYEGQQKMRLKELGTISAPDARSLVFQPWDKTIIKEIKNGLLSVNVGGTPVIEGEVIRISLPPLTEEKRNDYLKLLSRKTEAARVMIRNIRSERRGQLQEQQKNKEISDDQYYRWESELQRITDQYIEQIEEISQKKEKEISGSN